MYGPLSRPCIEWEGAFDKIPRDRIGRSVRRQVWLIIYGEPVPAQTHPICGNRRCVEPTHIAPGQCRAADIAQSVAHHRPPGTASEVWARIRHEVDCIEFT